VCGTCLSLIAGENSSDRIELFSLDLASFLSTMATDAIASVAIQDAALLYCKF
jgi:hypothetical protein